MDILTIKQALGAYALIALVIIAFPILLRKIVRQHKAALLNDAKQIKKYAVLRSWTSTIWIFSLAMSLCISIVAFRIGHFGGHETYSPQPYFTDDQIIAVDPPRTTVRKDKIPLPPKPLDETPIVQPQDKIEPVTLNFIAENITEDEQPTLELATETASSAPMIIPQDPLPKPEVIEADVEPIFVHVEQRPRFPGCEDMEGSNKEKEECAVKKLISFVYKNIEYPRIAQENNIQGKVYLQFVVQKDGRIADIKVTRDIGGGCGEEAVRVIELMNTLDLVWTPGRQQHQKVAVMFTLPIHFQLQ